MLIYELEISTSANTRTRNSVTSEPHCCDVAGQVTSEVTAPPNARISPRSRRRRLLAASLVRLLFTLGPLQESLEPLRIEVGYTRELVEARQ